MIRNLLIAVFYFISLSVLVAQNDSFLQANNAYNKEDFTTSISLYEGILNEGQESPSLYLNLGNAYLQSGTLGKAILYFEKGLKLDNTNQSLKQNLEYAKKQIDIPITAIPDFFVSRYWDNFVNIFSSNIWAALQILLLVGIVVSIGFWLLRPSLKTKKVAFYSAMFLCMLFLLSLMAGIKKNSQMKRSTHAIVITNEARLLAGASDKSELLLDLSEGVKVKLLDNIEGYFKVQLMDKEVGWISTESIETI